MAAELVLAHVSMQDSVLYDADAINVREVAVELPALCGLVRYGS